MHTRSLVPLICLAIAAPFTTMGGDDINQPRLFEHQDVRRGSLNPSEATIRINVNLALVPVAVLDSFGRNVTGLRRENFQVFDGGRQVPIATFGVQDQPITVGLVFDCSSSMASKFQIGKRGPNSLFGELTAGDVSFLVTVADQARLRMGLTSDFGSIEDALLFTHPRGKTSLLDGIYQGLAQMKKATTPHKALVVVSDGGDNASRYSLRDLERTAVESDTQIFAIGLYDNPASEEEMRGPYLMEDLTEKSGGMNFVIRSIEELRSAMARVGVILHNQYLLGYYPPDSASSGKYRKIKVKLLLPAGLPQLQVAARPGYYVPER